MKKDHLKHLLDIIMIFIILLLMSYSLIGEAIHEALGLVMSVLCLYHCVLNRYWFKNLLKGTYNQVRYLNVITNGFLMMVMFILLVSGILMSKYILVFKNNYVESSRIIHLFLSH